MNVADAIDTTTGHCRPELAVCPIILRVVQFRAAPDPTTKAKELGVDSKRILAFVAQKGPVSLPMIRESLKLSHVQANCTIGRLYEANKLRRSGETKHYRYEVV